VCHIARVLEAFPELPSLLAVASDGNILVNSYVSEWKGPEMIKKIDW